MIDVLLKRQTPCPPFQYHRAGSDDIQKRNVVNDEGREKCVGGGGKRDGAGHEENKSVGRNTLLA